MKTRKSLWLVSGYLLYCLAATCPTQAQVSADGTVSTRVRQSDNNFEITGGGQAGHNLFHSFAEFSVPTNGIAYFNNSLDIINIISRVTGRSISNIDGLLRANGSANLFLINPNGIIFGPNAHLDIGGSFLASTASSIKFSDGSEFSATNPQSSTLLTINVPIGLQFGNNPGAIINRAINAPIDQSLKQFSIEPTPSNLGNSGGLQVQPHQTLALVGGDVVLEGGNLGAPGGRIEIGSVGSNSLVTITSVEQGWALGYGGVENFQDIQLSQGSNIDATGDGGTISLFGRQITLTDGSQIFNFTTGEKDGGVLVVAALESLQLIGSGTGISTQVGSPELDINASLVTGKGGDISINTRQLMIGDGAVISSGTVSQGKAGDVIVNASEIVELTGINFPSFLASSTNSTGAAGNLTVNTKKLIVRDGSQIQAGTFGEGQGGNLTVNASESVELSGTGVIIDPISSTKIPFSSGLFASAGLEGIPPQFQPKANGGDLRVNTGELIVRDKAEVSVSNFGSGNAGNLRVRADSISLNNQGKITAETLSGEGGNISLEIQKLLLLRHNSLISTTAGTAQTGGNGGNITIDSNFIIAVSSENSDIIANAFEGNGGNITITAQGVFGIEFRFQLTPISDITASSQFGQSGIVAINRPDVDPQNGLVELPKNVIDVESLVAQGCHGSGKLTEGEFFLTGRGGLPPDPYETVEQYTGLADLGEPSSDVSEQNYPLGNQSPAKVTPNLPDNKSKLIIEAQGWIVDANGKVILTVQPLTVTPHSPGLTPATCYGFQTNSPSVSLPDSNVPNFDSTTREYYQ